MNDTSVALAPENSGAKLRPVRRLLVIVQPLAARKPLPLAGRPASRPGSFISLAHLDADRLATVPIITVLGLVEQGARYRKCK
jgi:hypothetical protein